eukprot:gene9293-12521_t
MGSLADDLRGQRYGDEFGVENIKNSKRDRKILSTKDKLQAELKLLEWHKMANNAAIKAALLQTKSTKQSSPVKPPSHAVDDTKWIKKVIQDEHIRPLEVSKDYMLDYERREKENAERLTTQVERHISTLKNLRVKLESRHELKTKTSEYREWQREFIPKKNAVMIGKTLDQIIQPSSPQTQSPGRDEDKEINDEIMAKGGKTLNKGPSSQELSNVLDSLNRLAELEQRISTLEKDNQYDQLLALEKPTANQRSTVEFKKKRNVMNAPTGRGPVGMVYELRSKQNNTQNWKVQLPEINNNNNLKAGKSRQSDENDQYDDDGYDGGYDSLDEGRSGPGIFITEGGDNAESKRDQQRRERQRQIALASAGQKNLRSRVQDKKSRMKEKLIGAKKHEEAMRELAKRKQENSKKVAAKPAVGRIAIPTKGISAGVKNKNKHLQDFEKLKQSHQKRKDDIDKGYQKQETRKKGGISTRFASQTAPAYNNDNHPMNPTRRAPATKTGGTVTRRTNQPTRKPVVLNNQTAPPNIAVTGMGGIRVIKANPNRSILQTNKKR